MGNLEKPVSDYTYAEARKRFLHSVEAREWTVKGTVHKDAAHQMQILHDDGLYRHLRFAKPNTSMGWFSIITSPGQLTIWGDMGCYVFARIPDMFDFFSPQTGYINPGYWAEKLQASSGTMEYSADLFKEHVSELANDLSDEWEPNEKYRLKAAVQQEIFSDEQINWSADFARQVLDGFEFVHTPEGGPPRRINFRSEDTWDWQVKDYTYHYIWNCHAVQWAVQQYREAKHNAD